MSAKILVIGAGPAGLATAACLKREGLEAKIVDRNGIAGGAYQRIYDGITLASPTRYTGLPSVPIKTQGEYVTVPEYRHYLELYAEKNKIKPEMAIVKSVQIAQEGFAIEYEEPGEKESFNALVVATGMYDFPVIPKIEGIEHSFADATETKLFFHAKEWKGPKPFKDKRILIVGGATSAVEIAEECVRAGIQPTVSARRKKVKTISQRFLGKDIHDYFPFIENLPKFLFSSFCAKQPTLPAIDLGFREFCKAGKVAVQGEVERFIGKRTIFADGSVAEFGAVILATGYRYEMPFLPQGVARNPNGIPLTHECESRTHPGLYFVGIPCGRAISSEFLRGISKDSLVAARKIKERVKNINSN